MITKRAVRDFLAYSSKRWCRPVDVKVGDETWVGTSCFVARWDDRLRKYICARQGDDVYQAKASDALTADAHVVTEIRKPACGCVDIWHYSHQDALVELVRSANRWRCKPGQIVEDLADKIPDRRNPLISARVAKLLVQSGCGVLADHERGVFYAVRGGTVVAFGSMCLHSGVCQHDRGMPE